MGGRVWLSEDQKAGINFFWILRLGGRRKGMSGWPSLVLGGVAALVVLISKSFVAHTIISSPITLT